MKKLTLFLFPLLTLLLACNNEEDPVYYKAMGEGYVYDKTTKEPVPFINLEVKSCRNTIFSSNSSYIDIFPDNPCLSETFSTDENGFYRVRFAKRYNRTKGIYNEFVVYIPSIDWYNRDNRNFDKDFIQKQKKTFKIDTIWIKK